MDRRRFLKYAAVSGLAAGSALAGYEVSRWRTSSVTPYVSTVTKTDVVTKTTTQTVRLASLRGRLFFDYNGNGVQDGEEPAVAGVLVQLKDSSERVVAAAATDSSGDYNLEDVKAGDYSLHLQADKKFRHMCRSLQDLRRVTDDYELLLHASTSMDIGMMEGCFTIPLVREARLTIPSIREAKFGISNLYDWDSRIGYVKWWDGTVGDRNIREGWDNHSGIDYGTKPGYPVIAPAPGLVRNIGIGSEGQKYAEIYHSAIGLSTGYNHLSKTTAKVGQNVARGEKFAETGTTGTSFPHLHFNIRWSEPQSNCFLDFYKPTFPIDEQSSGFWSRPYNETEGLWWRVYPKSNNPGLLGYWTKENDPQYSTR
jgi:murein DD-endopeptidase MepM/ murein hydrolase activator NlpD